MIKTIEEGLEIFKGEVIELIQLEASLAVPNPILPATLRAEIQSQEARIKAMKTVLNLSDEEVEKIRKEVLGE